MRLITMLRNKEGLKPVTDSYHLLLDAHHVHVTTLLLLDLPKLPQELPTLLGAF